MRSLDVVAILLTGALSAAMARPTEAQTGAAATAPAAMAANPKFLGTWEGPFTTDGPSGTMTVTVSKDGAAYKAVAGLAGPDVPAGGEPRELTFSGDKVSWKQAYGEYDVMFTATLSADGAQVAGTLEASQGGSVVAGGSYTLTKK